MFMLALQRSLRDKQKHFSLPSLIIHDYNERHKMKGQGGGGQVTRFFNLHNCSNFMFGIYPVFRGIWGRVAVAQAWKHSKTVGPYVTRSVPHCDWSGTYVWTCLTRNGIFDSRGREYKWRRPVSLLVALDAANDRTSDRITRAGGREYTATRGRGSQCISHGEGGGENTLQLADAGRRVFYPTSQNGRAVE